MRKISSRNFENNSVRFHKLLDKKTITNLSIFLARLVIVIFIMLIKLDDLSHKHWLQ